jgi:hypothetical protein
VWQAAVKALPPQLTEIEIAGWAGNRRATSQPDGPLALTLRGEPTDDLPAGWRFVPIAGDHLSHGDGATLALALDQLAPAIGRA